MSAQVEILKSVTLPYGVAELRSDNIIAFRPDIAVFKEYNFEILTELKDIFIEMNEGTPRPYLCDNRYISGIISKEEQAYINKHFGDFATKGAMISHSQLLRFMLLGYNAFFKPKIELRVFNSESKAIDWLLKN